MSEKTKKKEKENNAEKNTQINRFITVIFAVALITFAGYRLSDNAFQTKQKSDADLPIIDIEARESYERGDITKTQAEKRIVARLDSLEKLGNIKDWQQEGELFTITLNNDTIYVYALNKRYK